MNLTQSRLREVLNYDPETGEFTWHKPRPFCSAGKPAGGITPFGYHRVCIDGRPYQAHRLAWLYIHGRWPTQEIDHANGDRADNRLMNLREATPSQNQANKSMRRDNTSGVKGVTWDRSRGKWLAQIYVNNKRILLGRFSEIEKAAEAYAASAAAHFGEYARPERSL